MQRYAYHCVDRRENEDGVWSDERPPLPPGFFMMGPQATYF
eukprot:gene4386-6667_t